MQIKDMERSGWSRVLSKKQIIRDIAVGESRGKISLLKVLNVTGQMKRSCEGRDIVLCDEGFYWLQLALDRSRAWFTVMYDAEGRLVQIYVDVTDGNDAQKENPSFTDMYLDYVVHGDRVFELDRDELEEAYSSGAITREQYETALTEGGRIFRDLTENRERIKAFFAEQFEKLKAELDTAQS